MIGQRWLDSYKSICGKTSTCDIVSTGMCICYKLWKLVLIIVKCDTSLKKHVNIFIIHKTMSLTAADTILMTTAMPMWPYLISLQPMKEQTNDGDINNKMMWPESSSLWMNLWSIHLLLLLMKTQNVSLTFCFYANDWNIQKKNHILQFHKYLLNINFHVFWCWVDSWN